MKALALGLLARNKRVTVITDCCGFWSGPLADLSLRQMWAKGATPVTVTELLARRVKRGVRYPLHDGQQPEGSNGNGRRGTHSQPGSGYGAQEASGNGGRAGGRSRPS